jgi:ketosteroid isomerase-like protein
MHDPRLVGEALLDRTAGGAYDAGGPLPGKAGWLTALLVLLIAAGCSAQDGPEPAAPAAPPSPQGVRPVSADPELLEFLARHKEATIGMLNGDASQWVEMASHADDATLFSPFGGVERGWARVGPRYEAVAARLRRERAGEAVLDIELISSGVSGDLAYVVTLERSTLPTKGLPEPRSGFTRVTHVLRREHGRWVLAHRHMDHLPETIPQPPQ